MPVGSSPLIGRDRELRQALAYLQNSRLLSLTGAGGTGKTRLAEEVARAIAPRFPDGLWFIDGATSRNGADLLESIAATLGVMERPGQSLTESIVDHLSGAQTLLLLDNLEQIPDAAAVIETLLASEGTTVLVTSRRALGLPAEIVFPVQPFAAPENPAGQSTSALAENPAVALFVERAKDARPDFRLTDGNAIDIATICARLDGLPLAIELAAARTRMLNPGSILERLDSRFSLLKRGLGGDPRQQTLKAALDWSYDLLSPVEQSVLRRFGVFNGGATVFSAEAVIATDESGVDPFDVLDSLESLVDHNLLALDTRSPAAGEQRLRMLETIREYALDRLDSAGEKEEVSQIHGRYFLDQAIAVEPKLTTGTQTEALAVLEAEESNLRAALGWSLTRDQPDSLEIATDFAGALWRYWWMRGHYAEGARFLDAILASTVDQRTIGRARTLNAAGVMAYATGDLTAAREFHENARVLSEELQNADELATSLDNLGIVAATTGDNQEAVDHFSASLEQRRRDEDQRGMAIALEHLAYALTSLGDLDQARETAAESLALKRKLGDQQAIGQGLQQLGIIEMFAGDYAAAQDSYRDAISLAEAIEDRTSQANGSLNLASATEMAGDPEAARDLLQTAQRLFDELEDGYGSAYTTYMLGHVERSSGNPDAALPLLVDALQRLDTIGARDSVALCLETLAGTLLDLSKPGQSAMLLGAADAIRAATGAAVPGTRTAELARDRQNTLGALGQPDFDLRYETGADADPIELVAKLGLTPTE